jgi:predicted ester cyclase
MSGKTNKAIVVEYLEALRKDKSPATLDAYIAEDDLKHHIAMYEASFPGYWLDAEEIVAEGDRVMVRGLVRGVHKGQLMHLAPTNRVVAVPFFISYRMAEGKIVEHHLLVDMPALMKELGVEPAVM